MTRICLRSGFVYTASTASRRATSRPGVPPRLDATYREDPWALTFSLAASASRASSFLIAALCSWALKTTLSCSKKQKKMAELMPLEKARGPTPVKKVLTRATPGGESRHTPATAPAKDGLADALHIMRVLTTSRGVVAPAATAPAIRPMVMSAAAAESSCFMPTSLRCAVRIVSYAANFTAMSGTSSRSVGR